MFKKLVCNLHKFNNGIGVTNAFQLVKMVCNACMRAAELWSIQNALQAYVI